MRKFVLAAAFAGTALTLAACGETAQDTTATDDVAMADAETNMDTGGAEATAAVLDANSATSEELAGVEGVTPELAQAIVDGRPYAGAAAFKSMLMETLGEDEANAMRERVFVPVNLNEASREDIALIPGMTDRMIGEFLEYRPYEDMAEFDREIGKYVDEAEVARFRNYVTL